jgi:hypothetical protein
MRRAVATNISDNCETTSEQMMIPTISTSEAWTT